MKNLTRVYIPSDVKRRIKSEAAAKGFNLQEYLVFKLGEGESKEMKELKRRFKGVF